MGQLQDHLEPTPPEAGTVGDILNSVQALGNLNQDHLQPPSEFETRGRWVFQSVSKNLFVQIGCTEDERVNGKVYRGKNWVAKFKNGEYSTTDLNMARELRNHPNCGINGQFWDRDDMNHELAKSQLQAVEQAFSQAPGLLRTVLDKVQAGGFDHLLAATDEEGEQGEGEDSTTPAPNLSPDPLAPTAQV